MTAKENLTAANQCVLAQVNSVVLRRCRELMSHRAYGQRFRASAVADEGMEVVGLDTYDVGQPANHIDFSRLRVPPSLLPFAACNGELVCRRFERTPDQDLFLVIDLSRSMRYPLRWLYHHHPGGKLSLSQALPGKPTLLKVVAGSLLGAALESGLTVRPVVLAANEATDEPAIQPGRGSAHQIVDRIDRAMRETTRNFEHGEDSLRMYEAAARLLARRKGVMIILADFIDAVYDWHDAAKRRRWSALVELLAEIASTRALAIVRINHLAEVRPPDEHWNVQGDHDQEASLNGESCACDPHTGMSGPEEGTDVDQGTQPERLWANFGYRDAILRKQRQQVWQRQVYAALERRCRAIESLNDGSAPGRFQDMLGRVWSRLTER